MLRAPDLEIHAQMLSLANRRYLLMHAAEANDCEPEQIQQKEAVLSVAAYVTRIFLEKDPDTMLMSFQALLRHIGKHRYREKDGRSFPRRSPKPSSKWGLSGT